MKRLFSKLTAIALIGVLAMSMTACGGGQESSEEKWWNTTGEVEKDSDGNVIFDNVDISLSTIVSGVDEEAFSGLVAKFNAEYEGQIRVTVSNIAQESFDETVASQISKDSNAPDFIMSHQKRLKSMADMKLLQPFEDSFELSGIEISMNDFSNNIAEYAGLGYDNYTYGIPVDAQSCVIYYNKQLLDAYGGQLPQSHDELIKLCERVANEKKITPIAISTEDAFFSDYVFNTAILQNGGALYGDDYRANWYDDETNRQAFKDGLDSIRDLTEHSPKLAEYGLGESASLNEFLNNRALFFVSMPWYFSDIVEGYASTNGGTVESVLNENIGVTSMANWFALKEGTEDAKKIYGDSHFFAMSATVEKAEVKAAICEFIRWFTTNAEVGATWAEAGHVSVSTVILTDPIYNDNDIVKNHINNFYADINNFHCIGNTPYFTNMNDAMKKLFVDAMKDGASADDDNIKEAQDELNTKIDFVGM